MLFDSIWIYICQYWWGIELLVVKWFLLASRCSYCTLALVFILTWFLLGWRRRILAERRVFLVQSQGELLDSSTINGLTSLQCFLCTLGFHRHLSWQWNAQVISMWDQVLLHQRIISQLICIQRSLADVLLLNLQVDSCPLPKNLLDWNWFLSPRNLTLKAVFRIRSTWIQIQFPPLIWILHQKAICVQFFRRRVTKTKIF
jgi:hypothetical protein